MSFTKSENKYGRNRKRRLGLVIFLTVCAIFLLLSAGSYLWYKSNIKALNPSDTSDKIVVIQPGDTANQISDLLESEGVIKSAIAFDWYTRLNKQRGSLQAGTYRLKASSTVAEIVAIIYNGEIDTDLITILPGKRLDQIKDSFIEYGFSADEVESALNPSLYFDHPALDSKPPSASLEGYLYPESFQMTADTKLSDIVKSSLDQMASILTAEVRQALNNNGLSVHQAVILASLVEKEVDKVDEKPTVAQVFLKRLNIGMMLGSDATAIYGAEINDLELSVFADTPYNTRLYSGMPPGPISNVTIESLRAIAYPTKTEYLYFVSGDDEVTYFSTTLEEHERLTAEHCIEKCSLY